MTDDLTNEELDSELEDEDEGNDEVPPDPEEGEPE